MAAMPIRGVLWRDLAILVAATLVVRSIGAWLIPFPPHVDAAYYTMVAERLAAGEGFTAPVLWSFLEVGGKLPANPALPVPSNAHWMPLTSMVAALPMSVLGVGWRAGQVSAVILSSLLVPLTYVATVWIWRSRRLAVLAAVLAVAAGSLLLMYPLVESFAVFGVFGASALLASTRAVTAQRPGVWLVLAGAATGLAALTRIDGALLAVAPATAWVIARPLAPGGALGGPARSVAWGVATCAAFLLVVAPWLLRNVEVFGTPLPSAGGRLLWIRDYNEQLSIGLDITVGRYLEWGLGPILTSKLRTLVDLVGRTLALLGGILGLFFFAGAWMQRRDRRLWPYFAYVVVMFAMMTLVFTEHAPKGAFLHTAPAWLPIGIPMALASVAPVCVIAARWWRFLHRPATQRFVEVVAVMGAVVLSVAGAVALWVQWQTRIDRAEAAAAFLRSAAAPDDVVLAADPSSLYLLTGLSGVAMPFDPFRVVADVVDAYGVDWVVVVLDPGASRDPLGLWDGALGVDAEGASPTFLPEDPVYEAEGVRVFDVPD